MKSGDTYRFSLSWPMDTEERILAGEYLSKLGNKKSRFIVQLVCDYLNAHPEALDPKETIRFIINSTPVGDKLTDMIRSVIQSEFADKLVSQTPPDAGVEETAPDIDESIDDMLGNLDFWNQNE